MDFNLLFNDPLPVSRINTIQTNANYTVHFPIPIRDQHEQVECLYKYRQVSMVINATKANNQNMKHLNVMFKDFKIKQNTICPSCMIFQEDEKVLALDVKVKGKPNAYKFLIRESYISRIVKDLIDTNVHDNNAEVNTDVYMRYIQELKNGFKHPFTDISFLKTPGFCYDMISRHGAKSVEYALKSLRIYRHLDIQYLHLAIGKIVGYQIPPNSTVQIASLRTSPHNMISSKMTENLCDQFTGSYSKDRFIIDNKTMDTIQDFIKVYTENLSSVENVGYIDNLTTSQQHSKGAMSWIAELKKVMILFKSRYDNNRWYTNMFKLLQIIVFCIRIINNNPTTKYSSVENVYVVIYLLCKCLSVIHETTNSEKREIDKYYAIINVMLQYCIFLGRVVNELKINSLQTSKCTTSQSKCEYSFNIHPSLLNFHINANNNIGENIYNE